MKKILFVCTGNICRSSTAEAIAKHIAADKNVAQQFIFKSAGTSGFHQGESSDSRAIKVANQHGITFQGIYAKRITQDDIVNFDIILCMDRGHHEQLLRFADSKYHDKIFLFLQFADLKDSYIEEVDDPYYKDIKAFEDVFVLTYKAVEKIIDDNAINR